MDEISTKIYIFYLEFLPLPVVSIEVLKNDECSVNQLFISSLENDTTKHKYYFHIKSVFIGKIENLSTRYDRLQ